MPFRQRMRFRPRATFGRMRMNFGSFGNRGMRPIVHVTRNRFEQDFGPTTGGVEATLTIVSCVEAPANRGANVPAGSVLRSLVVIATPITQVAGKRQAMLTYRPAAENLATAIASYFDQTDPLTEEGVKMRRLAMSKCQTFHEVAGTGLQVRPHVFKWKGAKRLYDGDTIDMDVLTDAATTYDVQTWLKFSQ